MTMGLTGVVWLPRTATVNSTTLWAGAGPVPLAGAAAAWAAIASTLADATTTIGRVDTCLTPAWQGATGTAVLAKLALFGQWTAAATASATTLAAGAGAGSTAVGLARVAMPTLPEIAAVQATKAAAYSSGGVVTGAAQAAETADRALDVRAAVVMEAYEAATTAIVTTPAEFTTPPPLSNGSTATAPAMTHPAAAAAASAAGQALQPTLGAAGQATSSATSALSSAATAAMGGGSGFSPSTSLHDSGGGSGLLGAGGSSGRAAAGVTHPSARLANTPKVGLGSGAGAAGVSVRTSSIEPTSPARASPAGTGTPLLGAPLAGHGSANQRAKRSVPDFLKGVEYFADGRWVMPPTIGVDPATRS